MPIQKLLKAGLYASGRTSSGQKWDEIPALEQDQIIEYMRRRHDKYQEFAQVDDEDDRDWIAKKYMIKHLRDTVQNRSAL